MKAWRTQLARLQKSGAPASPAAAPLPSRAAAAADAAVTPPAPCGKARRVPAPLKRPSASAHAPSQQQQLPSHQRQQPSPQAQRALPPARQEASRGPGAAARGSVPAANGAAPSGGRPHIKVHLPRPRASSNGAAPAGGGGADAAGPATPAAAAEVVAASGDGRPRALPAGLSLTAGPASSDSGGRAVIDAALEAALGSLSRPCSGGGAAGGPAGRAVGGRRALEHRQPEQLSGAPPAEEPPGALAEGNGQLPGRAADAVGRAVAKVEAGASGEDAHSPRRPRGGANGSAGGAGSSGSSSGGARASSGSASGSGSSGPGARLGGVGVAWQQEGLQERKPEGQQVPQQRQDKAQGRQDPRERQQCPAQAAAPTPQQSCPGAAPAASDATGAPPAPCGGAGDEGGAAAEDARRTPAAAPSPAVEQSPPRKRPRAPSGDGAAAAASGATGAGAAAALPPGVGDYVMQVRQGCGAAGLAALAQDARPALQVGAPPHHSSRACGARGRPPAGPWSRNLSNPPPALWAPSQVFPAAERARGAAGGAALCRWPAGPAARDARRAP
jgi:hypothetical protein